MDKKLINEDIKNMKYLFGYKPGRVISEQDIDYTTDDYLDTTEMDEEDKRHPERLVRHSDSNKLVGIHKHKKGFQPNRHGEELGFDFHLTDIPHGTKFGGVEVGDFDYNDDGELDEDIFAGWDDPNNFKSTKLTKDDDSEDVEDYLEDFGNDSEDENFDFLPDEDNDHRDEMTEQYSDREHDDKTSILLKRKSSRVVRKFLESLDTEYRGITIFSLINCEYADFSDIDICGLPNISFINLSGTKNNFKEQGYECMVEDEDNPGFYNTPFED